jgi:hypothetical protein
LTTIGACCILWETGATHENHNYCTGGVVGAGSGTFADHMEFEHSISCTGHWLLVGHLGRGSDFGQFGYQSHKRLTLNTNSINIQT